MKKEVTKNYFGDSSESSMQVYTMGINTATANSPSLAQIVLDPSSYLAAGASNEFSNDFIGSRTAILPLIKQSKSKMRELFLLDLAMILHLG